jgi:hypothetical protein
MAVVVGGCPDEGGSAGVAIWSEKKIAKSAEVSLLRNGWHRDSSIGPSECVGGRHERLSDVDGREKGSAGADRVDGSGD